MVGTYPSPQSASPEGKDAVLAAEIAGNLAPVLADLAAGFVELAERRLTDEGWQEAQRADIAGRGAILFTSAVLEGETPSAAIEAAIHESRRAFMADLFDELQAAGSNRETAFLTLVMLDRENEERAGAERADYPLQWLEAAVGAVAHRSSSAAACAPFVPQLCWRWPCWVLFSPCCWRPRSSSPCRSRCAPTRS